MIHDLEAVFRPLRSLKVAKFVHERSLPPLTISSIDALVDIFVASDWDGRHQINQEVNPSFSFAFFIYAQRTAVDSVRLNSPDLLNRGLLALAIENLAFDYRDSLCVVAQIYHSAQRFPQISADELFQEVGRLSCPPFSEALSAFVRRSEASKSITVFGLKESIPPAPFDYEAIQRSSKRPSKLRTLLREFRRLIPILR
jgi:hypothetical protein